MISLGDTIVCINSLPHPNDRLPIPLRLHGEYKAQALRQCSCGAIFVDVGFSLDCSAHELACENCPRRFNDGIWWFDVKRFDVKSGRFKTTFQLKFEMEDTPVSVDPSFVNATN